MKFVWALSIFLCFFTGPSVAELAISPPAEENLPAYDDVCANAKKVNGVGYQKHNTDCDKFYQCYAGEKMKDRIAVPRQCPFGQYWDQDVPTCRTASEVKCKTDRCNLKQLVSHPMDSGNCRSYWKCNLQKSVGDCCPMGQRYKKYQGCEKDPSCTDPCPGDSFHQGPCDSRPVFGDGSVFQQYVEGVNWHNMTCPSNTQYSVLACGCVYHKGYEGACKPQLYLPFNNNFRDYSGNKRNVINHGVTLTKEGYARFDGNSYLEIEKFLDFDKESEITVAVRFLETDQGRLRAIMSNSIGTEQPSFLLLNSAKNVHIMLKKADNSISTLHTLMRTQNWNTVKVMHDENKMDLIVNDIFTERWAIGRIQDIKSNLFVGKSKGFENFTGFIDEIAVFTCRPKFIQT